VATAETPGDNTFAVGSAQDVSGTSVVLPVALDNDAPVKGLQLDVVYDDDVVAFTGVSASARGAGMAVASHVVSDGRARVVMYHDDNATVSAGEGEVAQLIFEVVGRPDETTSVVPADIVLADADGLSLGVSGTQGSVAVAAPAESPSLQISVLRNPGRPRTLQVLVNVLRGSGNPPVVMVDAAVVTMNPLSGTRFIGTYAVAGGVAEVHVTASDTNTQGPGTGQVTVTF
jgi:hypothetical protein